MATEHIGTLVVIVLKAKDLPDKHTFSKQDPFAQIVLGGGAPQKTEVDVKGGQHPLWDAELRVQVPRSTSGTNRTLEVSCWSREPRNDDLIGRGTIDIGDTLRMGEFDDWVKLSNNGTQRGEVYLEMTYYAAGPAPLSRRATKMRPAERLTRTGGETGLPAFDGPKPEPPKAQHLTPSPHGSRETSPYGVRASTPYNPHAPPDTGAVPSLLRPGHPHSPVPVSETLPLPPNDPLHARRSDPARAASPPLGASAYPPASTPVALQPARGRAQVPYGGAASPAPSVQGSYGGASSPAPGAYPGGTAPLAFRHQRTGSYGSYPGAELPLPYPGATTPPGAYAGPTTPLAHQRSNSQGAAYPGGFAFPTAQVSPNPYGSQHSPPATAPPYGGAPSSSSSYGGPSSSYGGPSLSYGAPSSMPGAWAYDAPDYGRRPEPALPDPFAGSAHGRPHPTITLPAARLGGFVDDSELPTPKADMQPRRQPAVPTSHLRQPVPDHIGYSGYGGHDARAEQEERDMELARQLDRELNA